MSQKHQTGQRLLCAAGIAFALLGLTGQSAVAQQIPVGSTESMTVVRDAESGQLRHATAAETAALQAKSASSRARSAPQTIQQKFHASGARGARVTDEFMSSSVAVRNADGKVEVQCFDAHDAAHSTVSTGHVHTNKVETE